MNGLVREMIELLRSGAAWYSISIRSDLAEDLPMIMAVRIQLQQLFMNLMLNGVETMNEGGGALELAIRSQRMHRQVAGLRQRYWLRIAAEA